MDTLDHYNEHAQAYVEKTLNTTSVTPILDTFLGRVRESLSASSLHPPHLLDAGSGSGRDTLAFLKAGCVVDAFDGSEALAQLSSELTGQTTQVMDFNGLRLPSNTYDGIWAMASLLHVPRDRLPNVFKGLLESLKPGGWLLATFKHGQMQRYDADGRAFTDLDASGLEQIQEVLTGFDVVQTQVVPGPDTAQGRTDWFEVWLRRNEIEPRLTERFQADVERRRHYAQGDCDAMALALAQATGQSLGLWVTEGPDPLDPEERWSEPVHAVVLLDPARQICADAYGIHQGTPPHLVSFREGDWQWRLVPSSQEEIREAFTSETLEEEVLAQAHEDAQRWRLADQVNAFSRKPSPPSSRRRAAPR